MNYSTSISLECPHCKSICQFIDRGFYGHPNNESLEELTKKKDQKHAFFTCSNCKGKVVTIRENRELSSYYPNTPTRKPKTNIDYITNIDVKKDYQEAIDCYNNNLFNACMVMARRAIHQLMIEEGLDQKYKNLYDQIENSGIGENLKKLLQKIKNFGNFGAHPDFCLYDETGTKIEDLKLFATLSLEFLDKFFSDKYEIDTLISQAPKSAKE